MNKFQALTAFVQVVERGGFTAASKYLGMSASAITKSIACLEDELHVQLFNRTTRRIAVTEYGQQFYERCVRILADLEDAETALKESSGAPSGRVRLVLPISYGRVTVVPALPQFYALYPGITLEIKFSDLPVDLIQEGYDLAVRTGDLGNSRFIRRVLLRGPMVTVASPDYLARHGTPKAPEELVRHNCIIGKNGPNWSYRRGNETVSVKVDGNLWLQSGDAYREAAVFGLGIAYSTQWLFRNDLKAGDLVTILDDHCREGIPISVVYPDKRHVSKKVAAVIDFLIDISKCDGGVAEPAVAEDSGAPEDDSRVVMLPLRGR